MSLGWPEGYPSVKKVIIVVTIFGLKFLTLSQLSGLGFENMSATDASH